MYWSILPYGQGSAIKLSQNGKCKFIDLESKTYQLHNTMQWSTSTPYKTTRFHWTINHSKFAHYSGHDEHPSAVFYLTKMKLKAVWIEWKQQGPFSRTISECTIFFDATYFWKKSTTFQNTFTIKTLNMARNYSYKNKPPKFTSKFIFLKSIM